MVDQVRQGDIYFVKVPKPDGISLSESTDPVAQAQGFSVKHSGIIAYGEITNHKHKIWNKIGQFFLAPKQMSEDHNVLGYVQTSRDQVTQVVHDEHDPVILDKDSTYEVRQQREHVPNKDLDRYVAPKVQRVKD